MSDLAQLPPATATLVDAVLAVWPEHERALAKSFSSRSSATEQFVEDTSELVIATKYEEPVYMYYLGSRVIVGYYGASLARDLELQPDVIVPRAWPEQLDALQRLANRAAYAATRLPVRTQRPRPRTQEIVY